MILDVRLEVLRQVVDAFTEESDLDFGGSGVGGVGTVAADNFSLTSVRQHTELLRERPRNASAVRTADQAAVAKEVMLAEDDGRMQSAAARCGQRHQTAIVGQHPHPHGRRAARHGYRPSL